MKKEAIIIAGPNGSGKTTFANNFIEEYPFTYINADNIIKEAYSPQITNLRSETLKIIFNKIETTVNSGANFIIETTLSGRYFIRLIESLISNNYEITIIYIFLENPKLCVERIKERVLKGGHYISDVEVERRFYRSKNNFWKLYRQYCDKWFVFYNSTQQFTELAIGKKDNYIVSNRNLFNIFLKDIKQ
ncbi:MAG: hypothetical protein A2X12_02815 [Bacteroidetes bacterium GWE2_29_8]|nr:MAG: hypothetical protein A2X12_02815 [Bacteroidetes bacterium GWE2_29_8]OFY20106.1 MAG: hypothetical protein A2X02_07010 [Bacteroidetes bacterium GWF2_29_10]